jgi:hypothetical protein
MWLRGAVPQPSAYIVAEEVGKVRLEPRSLNISSKSGRITVSFWGGMDPRSCRFTTIHVVPDLDIILGDPAPEVEIDLVQEIDEIVSGFLEGPSDQLRLAALPRRRRRDPGTSHKPLDLDLDGVSPGLCSLFTMGFEEYRNPLFRVRAWTDRVLNNDEVRCRLQFIADHDSSRSFALLFVSL